MNKTKRETVASVPAIQARIDRLLDGGGKIKAFASATVAGAYAIHGIRVFEGEKGRFVAMPQDSYQKGNERKYRDIFHAITAEARTALNDAVEAAYQQALAQQMGQGMGQQAATGQTAASGQAATAGQVTGDPPGGAPAQEPDEPEPAIGMAMQM